MDARHILVTLMVVAAFICLAYAQDSSDQTDASSSDPTCPIRRTLSRFGQMRDWIHQNPLMQSSTSSSSSVQPQTRLNRRKRQTPSYDSQIAPPMDQLGQQQQQQQQYADNQMQQPYVQPQPLAAPIQPSAQDVAIYNQEIRQEESRLRMMMNRMLSSPFMPSRDQTIQMATTLVTLVLMMALGPALGANAGMVQSIVQQIVPFIVAASVHYAADQAVPMKPLEAPITNVQLQPVQAPQSPYSQTI